MADQAFNSEVQLERHLERLTTAEALDEDSGTGITS